MSKRMDYPLILIACTLAYLALGMAEGDDSIVDPEGIGKFTPMPHAQYANWTDWESWEPSPDMEQSYPRYRSGYDLDGRVVYVLEFGALDERKVAAQAKERKEEFWRSYEWWIRRQEKDASFSNDQGMVIILDFDGYRLANSASRQALQLELKIFTFTLRENRALKYGFIVNVNFAAETFLGLAKPFLGDLLDKFEICGTLSEKWKPKLLKKIAASQLPPKYGGSKDWKPLGRNEYAPPSF